ncbi:hypothetical protein GALL_10610 [mine drainage metagenome]|uniref:Citrate transporter n=1 Tax=mine drainage metagenome TaxID=410659 RepID=A0A1J5TCT9_9ZZZZ
MASSATIPLWLILPFGLLLLLIAVMPLTPHGIKRFWDRFYAHIAIGLGAAVALYYSLAIPGGGATVSTTAHEYLSFICLIGSLFVVAGGIHIKVKGEATPLQNTLFLLIGAVAANVIGTTGASVVLIRPYIRMNKIRISAYHVVFFIFIVSNCGGSLTPIGDPPLFLGYLRGVPFLWLLDHVMPAWSLVIGLLLTVFFIVDHRYYRRVPGRLRSEIERGDTWRFEGGINVLFLAVIIGSVFLPEHLFLREGVMLAAALLSYRLTPRQVHEENQFSFGPIREVAFLFVGIFLTMMPALGTLRERGRSLGFDKPAEYYFASGSLSSVLDNAPTYLNFFQLAQASVAPTAHMPDSHPGSDPVVSETRRMLASPDSSLFIIAVSLGSVFFGAMTYIGNGPNFMVKSIADAAGVKTPSFFGYVFRYSLPVLLPILALCGWLLL